MLREIWVLNCVVKEREVSGKIAAMKQFQHDNNVDE